MGAISHSRVDSYLLCRRKDYYGYTLRLERVRENSNTSLGSAVHLVLATFYGGIKEGYSFDDALNGAWGVLAELYADGFQSPENRMDIEKVLTFYFDHEPFVRKGYTVLAVEEELNLAYEGGEYPFVVDLVLEDPKGYVCIVDHKTAFRFNYYDDTDMMPQIPKYIGAYRALGRKAHYGLYNLLRTEDLKGKKMTKPELLAAMPDIDPKMTVASLEVHAAARGISVYAGATDDQMHKIMEVRPSATRVVETFREQVGVAEEIQMRDLLPVEAIERTAWRTMNGKVCDDCWFHEICSEELRGGNVQIVLATEYRRRPDREKIPITEEFVV